MNTGNGGKDCARFGVMISAFIDGELGAEERAELDAHLEVCADCRSYLKLLRSVSSAAGDAAVGPPERLAEGIMYKIRLEAEQKRSLRLIFGRWRYATVAAAFCLALLGVIKLLPLIKSYEKQAGNASFYDMAASASSQSAEAEGYGMARAASDEGTVVPAEAGVSANGGEADSDTAADEEPAGGGADGSSEEDGAAGGGADKGGALRNYIVPSEAELKAEEGEASAVLTAALPTPAPSEDGDGAVITAGRGYVVGNTRGYEIYKGLKYEEDFYSVCIIYGAAPEELKDCEELYSGEGQTHYKAPLETMLDIELSKAYDEIYYGDLNADYGLVIVINEGE